MLTSVLTAIVSADPAPVREIIEARRRGRLMADSVFVELDDSTARSADNEADCSVSSNSSGPWFLTLLRNFKTLIALFKAGVSYKEERAPATKPKNIFWNVRLVGKLKAKITRP
jgi:hypothetical protein